MGKTFWKVVSAAEVQLRCKASMAAQGNGKNSAPEADPMQNPSIPKKNVTACKQKRTGLWNSRISISLVFFRL